MLRARRLQTNTLASVPVVRESCFGLVVRTAKTLTRFVRSTDRLALLAIDRALDALIDDSGISPCDMCFGIVKRPPLACLR